MVRLLAAGLLLSVCGVVGANDPGSVAGSDTLHVAMPAIVDSFSVEAKHSVDSSNPHSIPVPDTAVSSREAPTDSVDMDEPGSSPVRNVSGSSVGATVTVKGQARHKRKEISSNTIRREEIKKVVATAQDPLRALPTLPGVSAASDLSVRPIVRGGDQSETGVQLDGVPLLMPYHFGSIFSVFHQEAIEDFQLYSGVAPAQSEGMLSGTILARTRPAPIDTAFGGLDFSMLRGSGWMGIPLVKDKVGFWVSGQSMWYDWTFKRLMDLGVLLGSLDKKDVNDYESKVTLPTTWDVQSGLSFKFDREWLLDIGGFVAGDKYHVLSTTNICQDGHGQEFPCEVSMYTDWQSSEKRCSYQGQSIQCPDTLIHKSIPDTQAFVGLSNWMARTRLSWNPDKDLALEGVAAYQSLGWDVKFPGDREVVRDSANHVWKATRVDNGEVFNWNRSAVNLDLTGRKRWSDQHETSMGFGWQRGTEKINTDLPRPVAELIQGTTGNPLEVLGIYNDREVLIMDGQEASYANLDRLQNLDFRYNSNSTENRFHAWAEHRWDPDSKTRVRAGIRLATLPDGTPEIPNPRLQVQRQISDKDLVGIGLALHTQSDLPFEWRLAATSPLVLEKAWLGIVEWEHSFAPGWRTTVSGWGKVYQDLASSSIKHLPIADSGEFRSQLMSYFWQHVNELGVPDSVKNRLSPVLTNDMLKAVLPYIPASVKQDVAWWLEPRELAYASTGEGWATGLEASLRYQPTQGWMGWASAEWSMSRRKDRPDGIWYPFGLERPWKISWVNSFQIDKKWELSVRYAAMGGNPYTPFKIWDNTYNSAASGDTTLWIGSRNSSRFAPYERLDLRVSRESTVFGKPATFYYEVWNALNDPNFVLSDNETGQFRSVTFNVPFPTFFLGCEVRF